MAEKRINNLSVNRVKASAVEYEFVVLGEFPEQSTPQVNSESRSPRPIPGIEHTLRGMISEAVIDLEGRRALPHDVWELQSIQYKVEFFNVTALSPQLELEMREAFRVLVDRLFFETPLPVPHHGPEFGISIQLTSRTLETANLLKTSDFEITTSNNSISERGLADLQRQPEDTQNLSDVDLQQAKLPGRFSGERIVETEFQWLERLRTVLRERPEPVAISKLREELLEARIRPATELAVVDELAMRATQTLADHGYWVKLTGEIKSAKPARRPTSKNTSFPLFARKFFVNRSKSLEFQPITGGSRALSTTGFEFESDPKAILSQLLTQ